MFDHGTLSSSFLRDNLAATLGQVYYGQRRYLITRNDQAMAALVLPHELAAVEELLAKTPAQKEFEHMARMEAWRRAAVRAQPVMAAT